MHLLRSALLEGNPHHFESQAKWSDWLWDRTFDLYRLAGPLEISCETLHPSAFRIKPWTSIKAPRLYLLALTLVLWWPGRWSGVKSSPFWNQQQNSSHLLFSPQGSLCSELEDKEQGQKLLRIWEERRERKLEEKGNYSWKSDEQLYSFNFVTTDIVHRNT